MGRIIAGRAKGMRLSAPKGDATRPTTDRVKEALFSALASWFETVDEPPDRQLAGVAVLDLFTGSGGLALEAASRGASPVVAVDHRTAGLVRENARYTRLTVEVLAMKAATAVTGIDGAFDLVFVDPPYDATTESIDTLVASLTEAGRLAPQALVVVERSRRTPAPRWPDAVTRTWSRDYGETTLHFGALANEELT